MSTREDLLSVWRGNEVGTERSIARHFLDIGIRLELWIRTADIPKVGSSFRETESLRADIRRYKFHFRFLRNLGIVFKAVLAQIFTFRDK